jgi:hypothetical protein
VRTRVSVGVVILALFMVGFEVYANSGTAQAVAQCGGTVVVTGTVNVDCGWTAVEVLAEIYQDNGGPVPSGDTAGIP